jgi:hypothetical protein
MMERGEADIIRFPRAVRDRLGVQIHRRVRVGGDYQTELHVKKARKEDLKSLARMLVSGRIAEEEALYAGFVTKTVQQRVARHRGKGDLWLSAAKEPITIGADPEFGLVDGTGMLRRGDDMLPHDGPFGSDGPGAEVRPQAAQDHGRLVANIAKILKNPPNGAEDLNGIGGATYEDDHREYWFGGHIHLGRPSDLEEDYADYCYKGIALALDHLVALPFVRLDTPNPTCRRNGCKYGYGKAGTFDNGGSEASIRTKGNRFEYRVLSGLWLTHPDLAKITLGVTKCVAESAYARARMHDYDPEWTAAPASRKGLAKSLKLSKTREITDIINRAEPSGVTTDHLKEWERRVRELDFYGDYEDEVEALITLARHGPGEFLLDLKQTWLAGKPLAPKASKRLQSRLDAVAGK